MLCQLLCQIYLLSYIKNYIVSYMNGLLSYVYVYVYMNTTAHFKTTSSSWENNFFLLIPQVHGPLMNITQTVWSWLDLLIPISCNRVLRGTGPLQHEVALRLNCFIPLKGGSVICWTNTFTLRKLLKVKGRKLWSDKEEVKFTSIAVVLFIGWRAL